MTHTFNSSTQDAEPSGSLEFEGSLVYRTSSKIGSKATEKLSRKTKKPTKQKKFYFYLCVCVWVFVSIERMCEDVQGGWKRLEQVLQVGVS